MQKHQDGQISSVLVLGDDLLISTIWNFKGTTNRLGKKDQVDVDDRCIIWIL